MTSTTPRWLKMGTKIGSVISLGSPVRTPLHYCRSKVMVRLSTLLMTYGISTIVFHKTCAHLATTSTKVQMWDIANGCIAIVLVCCQMFQFSTSFTRSKKTIDHCNNQLQRAQLPQPTMLHFKRIAITRHSILASLHGKISIIRCRMNTWASKNDANLYILQYGDLQGVDVYANTWVQKVVNNR